MIIKKKNIFSSIKKEIITFIGKIYWYGNSKIIYFARTFLTKKDMRNITISILCISRERPKKLKNLLKSISEKTKNQKNIEFLLLIDKDDPEIFDYIKLIEEYKKKINIKFYKSELKINSERINFLAKQSKNEIIFNTNDDMHIETNLWDEILNSEAVKFNRNEPFCIWPNVDINKYKFLHCDFPIINRKWYEILDYLIFPKINHFYGDTWNCEISKRSGKYLISKKIRIFNIKRAQMIAEKDKTFIRLQEKHSKDKEIYLSNKFQLKLDSKKIKSN